MDMQIIDPLTEELLCSKLENPKAEESKEWFNIRCVGSGIYSDVMEIRKKGAHHKYALKIPKNIQARFVLEREIKIHSKLKHNNIIEFIYTIYFKGKFTMPIITEIPKEPGCIPGVILELGVPLDNGTFSQEEVPKLAKDLLNALKYLKTKSIIHRDIKPENIVLANGSYKLCDFGLSIDLNVQGVIEVSQIGTPFFQPLECLTFPYKHVYKSDVWSVGVTIYVLAYNMLDPFPVRTLPELIDYLKNIEDKLFLIGTPADDFIKEILFERAELESLMSHAYLA